MEDFSNKTPQEFVEYFMTKHNSILSRIGRRYLIPNRYTVDDIKQYISERILQILKARNIPNATNKIDNPEKYFKSCLTFYCIEYQRMHGYIFELPKRPMKNYEEDESTARSFGFKYLADITQEEANSLVTNPLDVPTITDSKVWCALTGFLEQEEALVVDCIYNRDMTLSETSKHLGVAQSTCWFRRNRAMHKIYSFFDNMSGDNTFMNIKHFIRYGTDSFE